MPLFLSENSQAKCDRNVTVEKQDEILFLYLTMEMWLKEKCQDWEMSYTYVECEQSGSQKKI